MQAKTVNLWGACFFFFFFFYLFFFNIEYLIYCFVLRGRRFFFNIEYLFFLLSCADGA